ARRAADAAQAEQRAVAEAEAQRANDFATSTRLAVQSSRKPTSRPTDFSQGVAAALALAVATPIPEPVVAAPAPAPAPVAQPVAQPAPQPVAPARVALAAPEPEAPADHDEIDEPEPVGTAPSIPTSASVAQRATIASAISLRDMNLIGIYGSAKNRRALVRLGNGKYLRVAVGDRLDGGRVSQIGDGQLIYVKNGRSQVLKMIRES
ncbi:hypothetical protein V8J36_10950, partial [Frigidibacter sp. MR17.14]